MSLECDLVIDDDVHFDHGDAVTDLLQHAALSEERTASGRWSMTLRLSTDATIADLHAQFFADPTPTDVISFPSGDEPVDGQAYLGDVVVSVETAAAQAIDAGHSSAREVAFLALHGLLHLCGYDDVTDDLRTAMHRRQHALLEAWERDRGRPW